MFLPQLSITGKHQSILPADLEYSRPVDQMMGERGLELFWERCERVMLRVERESLGLEQLMRDIQDNQ